MVYLACWFTFGAALGCVFLAIAYVKPLRRSDSSTLLEVVSKEYGKKTEVIASVLCSVGMFISIIAQMLSASALLMTLFPVKFYFAAAISCIIMVVYVVFGGLWSAGIGGVVKLILLCLSSVAGGVIVLSLTNGYHGIMTAIEEMFLNVLSFSDNDASVISADATEQIMNRFDNILARGSSKDIGSCISVILGVLSTQSYAQGIWAAKTDSIARKGAMISAVLTVPIGAACVLIGLYMRGHYVTTEELELLTKSGVELPDYIGVMSSTAQAFPVFIIHHIPQLLAGVVLGTLLITIIIGAAGLTLGSSTILVRDVFVRFNPNLNNSSQNLKLFRYTIVGILLLAMLVATTFSGTFINDLGFLSMGLRATAVFIPLTFALSFPGKIKRQWIIISIISGTAALFLEKIVNIPVDGLFCAIVISLLCCLMGLKKKI